MLNLNLFKLKTSKNLFSKKFLQTIRYYRKVLGIETSCDDTGAAIVSEDGTLLGEALNSQTTVHLQAGGIIPPVARDLHRKNLDAVVNNALRQANLNIEDIDVIATTVKPGLALCLLVGLEYTKNIFNNYRKLFIPIHHMEAHALVARFNNNVTFPYLVLLISGGHCLLGVVRGVDDFILLGQGVDDAPGEVFDKIARRLRLKDLPQCSEMSGGRAIEFMASSGDPHRFPIFPIMTKSADCNFSFSGLKSWALKTIENEERKQGISSLNHEGHLANVADFCASFQYMVFHHVVRRVQRAILFCEMKGLLRRHEGNSGSGSSSSSFSSSGGSSSSSSGGGCGGVGGDSSEGEVGVGGLPGVRDDKDDEGRINLVISGGVASNQCIRLMLNQLSNHYNCTIIAPPIELCTDNGVMIAWNGVELLRANKRLFTDASQMRVYPKCQLGIDMTEEVRLSSIKLPRIKLKS